MSALEFKSVAVSWKFGHGEEIRVFNDISFRIGAGEFVSLMGPNGCGKSTVLRLVTGLLHPTSGTVFWNKVPIVAPSVDRGFIPQQPKLFEWLTLRENVAFGPRMAGASRSTRHRIAMDLLARFGLAKWCDRYPSELSGGMKVRVALAMALATKPQLICLDETFGPLDFQTRLVVQNALIEIWREDALTILMVTHQLDDAMLADRILVLGGRPSNIEIDRVVTHSTRDRSGDEHSRTLVGTALKNAAAAAFVEESRTLHASRPRPPVDVRELFLLASEDP